MAIIVNADDFGLSEEVNNAIAEAFEKNLIDRTTLMVGMPAAEEAMELAIRKGFADKVGLHLNLTSGRPLSVAISSDPFMCNKAGEYTADFARNMKTRFFLPKGTSIAVEEEICAQFARYAKLGGTLWHIDSHHHVHTDPSIWRILKKVFADHPVSSVRLGRNMYRGGNVLMRLYKLMLNASIRKYCSGNPRYFGSAEDYREYIKTAPDLASRAEVEVMVHPVYDSSGNLADVSKGQFYALERLH